MPSHNEVDYSAFTMSRERLLLERTRTARVLNVSESLLDLTPEAGHPTASLSTSELETATKIRKFSDSNGYEFIGNISGVFPLPESIFNRTGLLSNFKMLTYGFIRNAGPAWLEIGQYRLEGGKGGVGSRRFAYLKIVSDVAYPSFCLDAFNSILDPSGSSKGIEHFTTESSDFNKKFRLYAKRESMVDTLSVLTPDVMEHVMRRFDGFDIEVREGVMLFVHFNGDIGSQQSIERLMDDGLALAHLLSPIVKRRASIRAPKDIDEYLTRFNYTRPSLKDMAAHAKKEAIMTALFAVVSVAVITILVILLAPILAN
jgi:hypothetical protein